MCPARPHTPARPAGFPPPARPAAAYLQDERRGVASPDLEHPHRLREPDQRVQQWRHVLDAHVHVVELFGRLNERGGVQLPRGPQDRRRPRWRRVGVGRVGRVGRVGGVGGQRGSDGGSTCRFRLAPG